VYETFGIGDRFGFIIDTDHGHCAVPETQFAPIAAFVDKFLLGNQNVDTTVSESLYGDGFDYARWTWWWGKPHAKSPPTRFGFLGVTCPGNVGTPYLNEVTARFRGVAPNSERIMNC
jgi:hypothetical protein